MCLEEARLLRDSGWPAATVNRAYYAMFHAATAALLQSEIRRRSHKGLISAFGQFFVKPGRVPASLHSFFKEAFDLRQQSDYQPLVDLTDDQAAAILSTAIDFVAACRDLIA
jgi:uncharacterized protein (UPF0332 family)